jgi:pimeloyl-ACP methyl ester carboxylesterase
MNHRTALRRITLSGLRRIFFTFAALLPFFMSAGAHAQSNPEYITLGHANGAVYRPDSGAAHTAFVVMHRVNDFMRHPACTQLAQRGFMVLCINPTAADNEAIVDWDQTMLDVKAGVEYLRKQPGIGKVLLFGHSGGGSVMAAYEATSEQGTAYCRGAGKLSPCADSVAKLPPADGIVFADAHPSDGVMKMRDLNPAIITHKDGSLSVNAALDPFSPANGFGPARSHYSSAFQKRFLAAQANMMRDLIAQAQKQQDAIKAGGLKRANGDMILIPSTKASAWLSRLDSDVEGARNTIRPEKLLKNDGSIVTQMIDSVAVTTAPKDVKTLHTHFYTAKAFLAAHAIRARDSQGDVDYCSTNSASICAVQYVGVPALVTSMGGYMFVRDGERLFDHAASKDKDFIVIEGALHNFTGCAACGATPDQYANARKNLFDYVRDWTNRHYPS